MSDILSLLQPMKDRLAAATPGPWHQGRESNRWENSREVYSEREVSATSTDVATAIHKPEDAALIAHAPTDQAKLIAAIEGVLEECDRMDEVVTIRSGIDGNRSWQSNRIRHALTQALGGDTA